MMLVSVILFWAVISVELFHPITSRLDFHQCERCANGFSSIFAASLTLFQQIVAGDAWGTISLPLVEAEPWTAAILFWTAMDCLTSCLTMCWTHWYRIGFGYIYIQYSHFCHVFMVITCCHFLSQDPDYHFTGRAQLDPCGHSEFWWSQQHNFDESALGKSTLE